MSNSDEIWLKSLLEQEPLPGDAFTQGVMSGLGNRRASRRRTWLWPAALLSVTVTVLGSVVMPVPTMAVPTELQAVVAILFGLGIWGALWVDTEPLGPLI